jgi:hypothetical protein
MRGQLPGKFVCKKCGALEGVRKYLDGKAFCFECDYLYLFGEYRFTPYKGVSSPSKLTEEERELAREIVEKFCKKELI